MSNLMGFKAMFSCIGILLCLMTFSSLSSGQMDCQRLTIDELGSTTAPSSQGLLPPLLAVGDSTVPDLQVFAMNIVCEAVASQRGEFRFVSVVASYNSSQRPTDGVLVGQFDLSCDSGAWIGNIFNTQSFHEPSDATLDTPLRRDCIVCSTIPPIMNVLAPLGTYDNITHCLPCDGCTGLNQCNELNGTCCNYYTNDVCVSECPANVSTLNETVSECVCDVGLTGSMCETDINECTAAVPGPCLNDGNCTNTQGSFMCDCVPEFTGNLCEEDVDECATQIDQCMNGATCNNTIGNYDCICLPTFTGRFCEEDVDECATQIDQCMNGATCNNTIGNYDCICLPTFTGRFCEEDVNECTNGTVQCMNGGTCNNTFGSFECLCPPTFNGSLCEEDVDECSVNNQCDNGGICTNFAGGFNCTCTTPGFEGMTCGDDIDECLDSNACRNNGICTNTIGSFNCTCAAGFEGAICDQDMDECNDTPCGIGGECNNTFGSFICSCDPGFEGDLCSNIDECVPSNNPCMNGGICNDTIGSFNCTCTSGFTGERCDEDIDECATNTNNCPSDEICINTVGNFRCDVTVPPPTVGDPLDLGVIIGIVVGAVILAIVLICLLLFCCCCYRWYKKDDYLVQQPSTGIVVRTWDPRTQHDRSGSIRDSFKSDGRNSFARSSISSVGSFLRASIRRLSGKRRSGRKGDKLVHEEEMAMKVTPL